MRNQSGQTLIETLVAAFILIMGISAALGLATYSLGATTAIKQETIALGLAREGIEVIKNVRDTNWMADTLSGTCYDFLADPPTSTAYCYPDWLNPGEPGQDISASSGTRTAVIRYDGANSRPWRVVATDTDFGLDLANLTASETNFTGVYYNNTEGLSATEGNSGFARAIVLTEDSDFMPFNQNTGSRLRVNVYVWWSGKGCTMTDTIPTDRRCMVTLGTYLTNWRNF